MGTSLHDCMTWIPVDAPGIRPPETASWSREAAVGDRPARTERGLTGPTRRPR
jgi:hypothetical protein